MATGGSIEEAAKAIPEKKESLRKAFDELKSLSSSLSFFTLQWKDLDGHFSSLQSSIDLGLCRLRALEPPADPSTAAPPPQPSSPSAVPPPELRAICSAKNGTLIVDNRDEVEAAIRSTPDPARLVLRAISGNYETTFAKETDRNMLRRSSVLLEILSTIRPKITSDLAVEARQLARKWKSRIPNKDERFMEALTLLQLVLAYRISAEFKLEELLDDIFTVATSKRSVAMIKEFGLEEQQVITLIEKLISVGKHTAAVKFIYAYNLVERFPPVPLLKEGLKENRRSAEELRKQGSLKAIDQATDREKASLQGTISVIQEYNLESEYPIEPLQQQLDELEKLSNVAKAERMKAKRKAERERNAERKRNAAVASLTNVEDKIIAKQRS